MPVDKARATVAMMQGESGINLNSKAVGDGGTSIGTAQWHAGRARELQAFVARMGKHWTDHEAQQQFFRHEMLGKYKGVYGRMMAAQSGEGALAEGINHFESPKYKQKAYNFRVPYLHGLRKAKTGEAAADAGKPTAVAEAAKPAAAEAVKTAGVEAAKDKATPVALAGARAMGGPVQSGLSYLVGERGPEIFTPGATGGISTNATLNRLADVGSRTVPADQGGTSPEMAPSPAKVAQLRPQGGNTITHGDRHYAPTFQVNGAQDPEAISREVHVKFREFIRQMEAEQRGLLSD